MPICTRDGFDSIAKKSAEKFQDNEEVFYCETTKEIFRDYEEYFRHVMLINSTIWQCEETGRENLTYVEAMHSEKKARKKIEAFKECLRAPTLLAIEKAQQAAYKDIFNIVYAFLRDRYFLGEIVQACITSSTVSYHECKVIEIIKPNSTPTPTPTKTIQNTTTTTITSNNNNNNKAYDPTKLLYKLQKLSGVQADCYFVTPPINIKRGRIEFSRQSLQLFIKDSVQRVEGLIKPKPEKYQLYVTDKQIQWSNIFIGDLPYWEPAKSSKVIPKKVIPSKKKEKLNTTTTTNNNKKVTEANAKNTSGGGGGGVNSKKKTKQSSISKFVKDIDPIEKSKQEKSLQEQMERIRKEKEEKAAAEERKRLEIVEKIKNEVERIQRKTDDLERDDQKLLPTFRKIQTLLPYKYFGDFIAIQEFLHSFAGLLSGIDAFNKNITFFEMTRAFTVREVAGPLSDIFSVLLGSIFALQNEEDEECNTDYVKPKIGAINEPWITVRNAVLAHVYIRKHLSNKLHHLPLDPQTISEVLRLHLLASGASTDDKSDRWRYMYRNGYFFTEDPGLVLRIKYPHILKALKMYTVYQLPISDILKIVNCLIDQILTYSSLVANVDERGDNVMKSKQKIRILKQAENKRISVDIIEKKKLQQAFALETLKPEIKDDAGKKQKLQEELKKKIDLMDVQRNKEKIANERDISDELTSIFNFMVYLGMDRAYRKYYVFESISGLFIEHPDEIYDTCLADPPNNWKSIVDIPKNRKDLGIFLRKHFNNLGKDLKDTVKTEQKDFEADKENLENLTNGKLNGTKLLNGEVKTVSDTVALLNGVGSSENQTDEIVPIENDENVPTTTQYHLYMCTGNPSNCIVHNPKNSDRVKWSFLCTEIELETLINRLNPLGERESHLLEQLITFKSLILKHIKSCPMEYLTLAANSMRLSRFKVQMNTETNRRYSNATYGMPVDTDINEIMYNSCMERILQLEVDITSGSLGRMKVIDIEKWRTDLFENKYDPQVELVYGVDGCGDMKSIDPGENLINLVDAETVNIDESSEDSKADEIINYESSTLKNNVITLASALLQIEQSIEQKFFKPPFGLQKEIRDKVERQNQMSKAHLKLKYWEVSLMKSCSFSSVFLHLNILYDSIKWSRSINRSCCIICRRRSEPEKMLLCDECNAGTHMFCLKPKLKKIPDGNWYCRRCVDLCGYSNNVEPEKKNKRRRFLPQNDSDVLSTASSLKDADNEYLPDDVKSENRRRNRYKRPQLQDEEIQETLESEHSDDEMIFENGETESEEDENQNENEFCESANEEVANSDEVSDEEEDEEGTEEEEEEEETQDENEDEEGTCNVCSYNGCEVSCNVCALEFHLDCVELKRVPRATWKCSKCKPKEEKKRKIRESLDSEYSDDSDEPLHKRKNRGSGGMSTRRTAKRTSAPTVVSEYDDGPRYTNNNRRSRRTGDNLPLNNVILYDLLDDISKNDNSWPFLRPVLQSEVPDYYQIIKRPMDFAKIKSKLNMGHYRINEEVLNDIQVVFKNCDIYNKEGNEIYNTGASLEKFIINRCKELNLPYKPSDMNSL